MASTRSSLLQLSKTAAVTSTLAIRSHATLLLPRPQPFVRISNPALRRAPSTSHYFSSSPSIRNVALEPPEYLDEGERKVFALIKEGLQPTKLEVQDISGGCGSMYGIDIVSEQFKGLTTIKQHRLVNKVLGDEIKKWHGVQLKTKAPEV